MATTEELHKKIRSFINDGWKWNVDFWTWKCFISRSEQSSSTILVLGSLVENPSSRWTSFSCSVFQLLYIIIYDFCKLKFMMTRTKNMVMEICSSNRHYTTIIEIIANTRSEVVEWWVFAGVSISWKFQIKMPLIRFAPLIVCVLWAWLLSISIFDWKIFKLQHTRPDESGFWETRAAA